MRPFRSLLVPLLLGLALLAVAIVTRTGILARKDPGRPINRAMREALGQVELPPGEREYVERRYPEAHVNPSGLRMIVDRPGTGGHTPERGGTVAIRYRGWLLDGTPIDDGRPEQLEFRIGAGRVIRGWEEAVLQMTEGEKRTLIVPPWLAYGATGVSGRIPPDSVLVFEVELVEIRIER